MALGLAAAAMAMVGCGGTDPNPNAVQATPKTTVVLQDGFYQPRVVRVPAGSRVTWVNRASPIATVETDGVDFFEYDREKLDAENKFDLHILQVGEAESVHFDTPGRYAYHSSLNLSMKGVVIVTEER